jgi:hypothetical protein
MLVVPLRYKCQTFPIEIADLSDEELNTLAFLGDSEPFRHYIRLSLTHYCPSSLLSYHGSCDAFVFQDEHRSRHWQY